MRWKIICRLVSIFERFFALQHKLRNPKVNFIHTKSVRIRHEFITSSDLKLQELFCWHRFELYLNTLKCEKLGFENVNKSRENEMLMLKIIFANILIHTRLYRMPNSNCSDKPQFSAFFIHTRCPPKNGKMANE